jgi:hypothetical protein
VPVVTGGEVRVEPPPEPPVELLFGDKTSVVICGANLTGDYSSWNSDN